MVQFQLLEVKGEYDFNSGGSEYKTELNIGNAKLKLKHDMKRNCAKFELEGPMWEVGYDHKGQVMHGKKKWWLTKNLLFVVRQDVVKGNFGVIPSPELQLEHTLKNVAGLDKQKLEVKYDTFLKKYTLEEEVSFGKCYKVKSAVNSATGWKGAGLAAKAEFKAPYASELEFKLSPSKPALFFYKIEPMRGLKLKLFTDSSSKKVSAEVEAEFVSEGMKVELKQFVSAKGWSQPLLTVGYKF